ncbi:hypothetical protein PIB30_065331 [Stylosanthes scabra]|uniref:Uncharacterized protein n=1 Tax=Stylosanthes scabra TaxID=79078 RepID=A0ABU6QMW2_9FABA|nr:hypothetical protein [Stylosanthes scabra]
MAPISPLIPPLVLQQFNNGSCEVSQVQEVNTTLSYIVDIKPKLWLPVHLIEGRLCNEIKRNLVAVRDESHKAIDRSTQKAVVRKLKEKDDDIQRMGKLNFTLQERVKSLENQLWKNLAQTNEAISNSHRSNLEQVLAHVTNDDHLQ